MAISVTLSEGADERVRLTHYEAGEECRAHRHDWSQTSLLIAGGYVEECAAGTHAVHRPTLSRKPAMFEHQNRFGEAGALILSINRSGSRPASGFVLAPLMETACGHRVRRAALGGADAAFALAGLSAERGGSTGTPPDPWLSAARDQLAGDADLSIQALARAHRRHPVSLARDFRRAFGTTPSRIRQEARTARAIARIIRSSTLLAEIACDEGFSDQAHMNRAVTGACGWAPARLRRLMRPG